MGALERIIAGPEKKDAVMSEKKKKLVAYHEAGHALVGALMPEYDPVTKISIVLRTQRGAPRVWAVQQVLPREPDVRGARRPDRRGAHLRRGRRHDGSVERLPAGDAHGTAYGELDGNEQEARPGGLDGKPGTFVPWPAGWPGGGVLGGDDGPHRRGGARPCEPRVPPREGPRGDEH